MDKIIALVGDFYHPADYLREGLEMTLGEMYSLRIEDDYQEIDWDNLKEYDLFILAASGNLNPEENDDIWMTKEHQHLIDDFVSEGGGLMILHSGLAGYETDGLFREIVRGHFLEHPEKHPDIDIRPLEDKILTRGIEEFTIVDEQYFVDVDEERTDIFLEAESVDFSKSTAGWAHQYGDGKVYCLTPGHTIEVLSHKMMKQLIMNGVEWMNKR